jgi:4-hydroxy-3-polyprenylbenzoate decarboxylase
MNAMWGAGQMMFNKIMVVTDQTNPWDNLESFVRQISRSFDPVRDIVFSAGPMDVLDHSSAKFAFGSKMGIDATTKFPEELDGLEQVVNLPDSSEFDQISSAVPLISAVNSSLLERGISILILGVDKGVDFSLSSFTEQLLKVKSVQRVKLILLVDAPLPLDSLEAVVWYVTGNIDPKRDCKIVKASDSQSFSQLVVDGTRKTGSADGFQRDWPNPVVSAPETIRKVDAIWPGLGIGEAIASPSLRYFPLKRGEGAVSE